MDAEVIRAKSKSVRAVFILLPLKINVNFDNIEKYISKIDCFIVTKKPFF
jgi:hypothetical protein